MTLARDVDTCTHNSSDHTKFQSTYGDDGTHRVRREARMFSSREYRNHTTLLLTKRILKYNIYSLVAQNQDQLSNLIITIIFWISLTTLVAIDVVVSAVTIVRHGKNMSLSCY